MWRLHVGHIDLVCNWPAVKDGLHQTGTPQITNLRAVIHVLHIHVLLPETRQNSGKLQVHCAVLFCPLKNEVGSAMECMGVTQRVTHKAPDLLEPHFLNSNQDAKRATDIYGLVPQRFRTKLKLPFCSAGSLRYIERERERRRDICTHYIALHITTLHIAYHCITIIAYILLNISDHFGMISKGCSETTPFQVSRGCVPQESQVLCSSKAQTSCSIQKFPTAFEAGTKLEAG